VNDGLKTRANGAFTIVEVVVVITIIGLLAAVVLVAYDKVVNQAKVAKSLALINTLAQAKSLFVTDPQTLPTTIATFNGAPDSHFALIAPYIRINGAQPSSEADLLAKSGMPASGVTITLGTVDDTSSGGTNADQAPTVTGYGM
jgi:prepilin-type N-terminal cleavage/methylation domain-containing protein